MMKTIRFLFLVSFGFFTSFLFGQQAVASIPDSLSRHYYNIVFPKLSPDSRYIAFNKSYDRASDTVVLVDRKNPEKILFESGGVPAYSVMYTSQSNLFMRQGRYAQLILLPSLNKRIWKNVKDCFYHKALQQIVVMQNDTVKVYGADGHHVKSFSNIMSLKNDENVVYYTEKKDSIYVLREWDGYQSNILHSSKNNIMEVRYRDAENILIAQKDIVTDTEELIYKKICEDNIYSMKNWFTGSMHNWSLSKINNKGAFYIHFFEKSQKKDKEKVDIWYGNDKKIQTKFFDGSLERFFIWNPSQNYFKEIKDKELSHHFNIGNSRYLLSFDPYFHHDYTKKFKTFNLHLYDIQQEKYEFIADAGTIVFTNKNGSLLLTYKKKMWELYDIESKGHCKIPVPEYESAFYSEDGKTILFEGTGKLYKYDISSAKLSTVILKEGFKCKIKNGLKARVAGEFNIYRQTYSISEPVIIEMYDSNKINNALFSYNGKSIKSIIEPTSNDITEVIWDNIQKTCMYVKSNINMPPQLIFAKGHLNQIVFSSNKHDREAELIKHETVSYKNSSGIDLKGVLLYPIGFDPEKKYPMVVIIYQKFRYMMNKYLIDGIGMMPPAEGVNVRTLLRKGYIVYMPDIVYDARGTGRSALDCVNKALDAIQSNTLINFTKVALIGHSHGGYETNFIATQSNRFATYVSGAGNSDLVRSYHSFNYNFKRPFFWQYEDGQYEMPGSFLDHKALYIDNSPIYHAEKVSRPILLWTGMEDYNIFWEQTMEFYLGLRRNQKHVISLFYPKDEHSLTKPANRIDLYSRISHWLDYHLKDKKVAWIENMYK